MITSTPPGKNTAAIRVAASPAFEGGSSDTSTKLVLVQVI